MARTTGPSGRSVTRKVFAILDVFSGEPRRFKLTEIATRTGMPISTVARHLAELVEAGWLERSPTDGAYEVGIRLWEIGGLAPRRRSLRDAAFPYLQDLYEAVRQNVQLVVLDDLAALCVERVYGKRAVPTETDVGDRAPLHATATGKAMIAHAEPEVVTAVLSMRLTRFTPSTITDPTQLTGELRRIRETGISVSREERGVGVAAIASAIRSPDRRLLGAVGVVAPADVNLDRFALAVRTVALAIGRSVGGPSPVAGQA